MTTCLGCGEAFSSKDTLLRRWHFEGSCQQGSTVGEVRVTLKKALVDVTLARGEALKAEIVLLRRLEKLRYINAEAEYNPRMDREESEC